MAKSISYEEFKKLRTGSAQSDEAKDFHQYNRITHKEGENPLLTSPYDNVLLKSPTQGIKDKTAENAKKVENTLPLYALKDTSGNEVGEISKNGIDALYSFNLENYNPVYPAEKATIEKFEAQKSTPMFDIQLGENNYKVSYNAGKAINEGNFEYAADNDSDKNAVFAARKLPIMDVEINGKPFKVSYDAWKNIESGNTSYTPHNESDRAAFAEAGKTAFDLYNESIISNNPVDDNKRTALVKDLTDAEAGLLSAKGNNPNLTAGAAFRSGNTQQAKNITDAQTKVSNAKAALNYYDQSVTDHEWYKGAIAEYNALSDDDKKTVSEYITALNDKKAYYVNINGTQTSEDYIYDYFKTYNPAESQLIKALKEYDEKSGGNYKTLPEYDILTYESIKYMLGDMKEKALREKYQAIADKKLDENFKNYVDQYINAEKAQVNYEFTKRLADRAPISTTAFGTAGSFLTNLVSPVGLVEVIDAKINKRPIDPNSPWYNASNATENIRSISKEKINKSLGGGILGKFGEGAYDLTVNLGDFFLANAVGGQVGKAIGGIAGASAATTSKIASATTQALMSTRAGSDTIKQAKRDGASDSQALLLGIASAGAEAFFEKFSIERFKMFKNDPVAKKTGWTFLKSIVKGFLPEGTEELSTEVTNMIFDNVIMGENSAFNRRVKELMTTDKLSEDKATVKAAWELIKQGGYSFILGGLSGSIMAATGHIMAPTIKERARYLNSYAQQVKIVVPDAKLKLLDPATATAQDIEAFEKALLPYEKKIEDHNKKVRQALISDADSKIDELTDILGQYRSDAPSELEAYRESGKTEDEVKAFEAAQKDRANDYKILIGKYRGLKDDSVLTANFIAANPVTQESATHIDITDNSPVLILKDGDSYQVIDDNGYIFTKTEQQITQRYKAVSAYIKKGETIEDSSVVLEKDERTYPYEMQEVIEGYEDAVNDELLTQIEKVKSGNYKDNDTVYFSGVSDKAAEKIKSILGIDVSGFKSAIEARQIKHILKRHGEKGIADTSMRNDSDIARIEFVLDNFDNINVGGTTEAYTTVKSNGHTKTANTVEYSKKINGTYYVIQAVPDTKRKTLYIVSAYIGNEKVGTEQLADVSSPDATSDNGFAHIPTESSISQSAQNVNSENSPKVDTKASPVNVGDVFTDTKNGDTIKVISRDESNTTVEFTDKDGNVATAVFDNKSADVMNTNPRYVKAETISEQSAEVESAKEVESVKEAKPEKIEAETEEAKPTVEATQAPSGLKVGDTFVDTKSGSTLKVVGRDNNVTTIEKTTADGKVIAQTFSNKSADNILNNPQYTPWTEQAAEETKNTKAKSKATKISNIIESKKTQAEGTPTQTTQDTSDSSKTESPKETPSETQNATTEQNKGNTESAKKASNKAKNTGEKTSKTTDVFDVIAETKNHEGKYWSPKKIEQFYKDNPDLDFIERIYQGDKNAIKELKEMLASIDDADMLDDLSWYVGETFKDKGYTSKTNYDTYKIERNYPYRGAIRKFRNAIRARINEIMTEKNNGTNLGIENGKVSLDDVRSLFTKLNSNDDLTELADRVFKLCEQLHLDISFVNKMLVSADGLAVGDIVQYKTSFFNDTAVTDQEKARTILHELIHSCTAYALTTAKDPNAKKKFASNPEVYQRLMDTAKQLESIYNEIKNDPDFKGLYGIKDVYEMVAELSNPEFVEKLQNKTLWDKIVDAICTLFGIVKKSDAYSNVKACVDFLFNNFDKGLYDQHAKAQRQALRESGKGDGHYSFSSIANTFFGDPTMTTKDFESKDYKKSEGYKNYVNKCVDVFMQTHKGATEESARKEIEKSIEGIVDVAIASKKAGYDIFDDNTKRNVKDSKKRLLFSSLEPNSDYFTSSDISTICDKRQNFAEIYDAIVKKEEELGVPEGKRFFNNVDNYFYIHSLMAEKGLTTPCRQCYVESMRKNLAPMAKNFLKLIRETDIENKSNDQLYQQSGKNKGTLKSNNAELREAVLEKLAEYGMSPTDLTIATLSTADGLAELKVTAPLIYEAFNSFYGQSKPKMPKSATPFRFGELTALLTDEKGRIKQSLVDKINSTGGFRLQSYSDFQIQNYVDVLQTIFEAGTLGLTGHAYTKVPAFLTATEGTNLKRNISIFMYKDGTEWKIDEGDSYPATLDELYGIVANDKSGNTSIIAVSQNEDMSAWIMANDNVGYGIPFHKSGMKMDTVRETKVKTPDGRTILGYAGIKDHTRQQTEVWAKTTADHKANTKVKNGIDIYSFWDFDNKYGLSKNDLIKKNLMAYIDACEKAGYLPKFREYVMNNGKVLNAVLKYSKDLGSVPQNATVDDISFKYKGYTIPYGYHKFLGDFGMFTPDGKASPISPLSLANYDFKKAVEFFSNSEELHRNEILQQFANDGERQKMRESNLSTEELSATVQERRDKVADRVVNRSNKKFTITEDGGTNEGNDLLSGNERRRGNESAQKQTEGLSENTRRHISGEILSKGQTEEKIVDDVKLTLVKEEAYNDDMKFVAESNKEKGLNTHFFLGNGAYKFDSKKRILVDGMIVGNDVYLRYDGKFSPQTLNLHEDVHDNWNTEKTQKAKNEIWNSLSEADKTEILSRDRYKNYAELYNGDMDKVWEEFFADVLAGMSTYSSQLKELTNNYWNSNDANLDNFKVSEYTRSTDAGGDNDNLSHARDVLFSAGNPKWHPDLSKRQLALLMKKIKADAHTSVKSIKDNVNWIYTNIDDTKVFAIYTTTNTEDPTLLYESKEEQAIFEKDVLLNLLEVIENGKSVDRKSDIISRILDSDWLRQGDGVQNSARLVGRGSGNRNAGILQRQSSGKPGSAFKNVIENLFEISDRKGYSLNSNNYANTFYSHMAKVVDGIKQEKLGADSVVNMLRGKGVKNEEIKWSGIESWLEGKKSVTKAELQEFVAGSMLQIEEITLHEDATIDYTEEESSELDFLSELISEKWEEMNTLWEEKYGEEISWDIRFADDDAYRLRGELKKRYKNIDTDSFYDDISKRISEISRADMRVMQIKGIAEDRIGQDGSKSKWHDHKLDGGKNYREITFKMPNSDYTNQAMTTHWGEDAKGILAHARVQDFDIDGKKMLFVEEIQSDWHNEGHKKGYVDKVILPDLSNYEIRKVGTNTRTNTPIWSIIDKSTGFRVGAITRDTEQEAWDALTDTIVSEGKRNQVPDAPFRDNYHEYVLKRLIRMAVENGYDSIGWTTADIQSKRWSEEYAEGYRIEYDQDIPKFLNKYGKKWGAKVDKESLRGTEVWSMDITDSMKDSVLYEGQPMYSLSAENLSGDIFSPNGIENRINELRSAIEETQDELDLGLDLTSAEEKSLNNKLFKLQHDLDKLIALEKKATVKTPIPTIIDNLSNYRLSDLHSLAEQISEGNWDGYEELSRDELESALEEELTARLEDLGMEDQNDKKFGFYVRPAHGVRSSYSLSTEADTDLDVHASDSEGKTLTKEQVAYFKDSKVRDEDGNLRVMYHGTPTGGFTEFKLPHYLSPLTSAQGAGYYFTDKRNAKQYTKALNGKSLTKKQLYEVYLNITNPLEISEYSEGAISDDAFRRIMARGNYKWGMEHTDVEQRLQVSRFDSERLAEMVRAFNGEEILNVMKEELGHDGVHFTDHYGDIWVAWDANQIKSVDNTTPTQSLDIHLMSDSETKEETQAKWDEALEKYGAIQKGETPARDIDVPLKRAKDEPVSQFARTALEAGITPNEVVDDFQREIMFGKMAHEVITDKKAEEDALAKIKKLGFAGAVNNWNELFRDEKIGKKDFVFGMVLYNQAVTNKDYKLAMKLISDLTIASSQSAQVLQSVRMLKKMSPDGTLYYLEKSVEKMNEEFKEQLGEKFENIEIDSELMKELYEAETTEARDEALEKIEQNIADQIPATLMDKWNAWRYLAMLGNVRTHGRNIFGNMAFWGVRKAKNLLGAVMEKAIPVEQRTKSIKKTKESVSFAKEDAETMKDILTGTGGKYEMANKIQQKRTIFKTKWLEFVRKKNFDFLEDEDWWFLKDAYQDSLAQLITARKIDVNFLKSGTSEANDMLNKIRAYAINEAKIATFRQASALGKVITKAKRNLAKNKKIGVKSVGILLEGVMPFTNVPINIAKQGVEYSPIGLMKGIKEALWDVRKGDKTASEAIDALAKGLTGTAIVALGVFLKAMGWIVAEPDDDDKKKGYDKMRGNQSYALQIGDFSYTIDWLTPSSLPLFVGVELCNLFKKEGVNPLDVINALSKIADPMVELSVLQGVSDALTNAKYTEENPFVAVPVGMLTSYLGQALPTLGGQIARLIDNKQRTVYIERDKGFLSGEISRFVQTMAKKIPLASMLLEPQIDAWGKEKTYGSVAERIFESTVSPGYYSKITTTEIDEELNRLFEETGGNAVYPASNTVKSLTKKKITYNLNARQSREYAEERGKRSLEYITKLLSSDKYRRANDEQKLELIQNSYTKAKEDTKDFIIQKYFE